MPGDATLRARECDCGAKRRRINGNAARGLGGDDRAPSLVYVRSAAAERRPRQKRERVNPYRANANGRPFINGRIRACLFRHVASHRVPLNTTDDNAAK